MVALVQSNSEVDTQSSQHDRFLAMLPQIRRQALTAFRNQRFEAREELIQEVIANCYRAWVLLVRRGKESVVYPTPLAQYAIRQVRDGRRVGGRLNLHDIMSAQARRYTESGSSGSIGAILKTESGTKCSSKIAELARPRRRRLAWT